MSDVVRSLFVGYIQSIEQCNSLSALQEIVWYASISWYDFKLTDSQFSQIIFACLGRCTFLRRCGECHE